MPGKVFRAAEDVEKLEQKLENQTLNEENQQEIDDHDKLFMGPMPIFEPIPFNNVFMNRVYD